MRILFLVTLLLNTSFVFPQKSKIIKKPVALVEVSPLAAYSKEWNKPQYLACNTAKHTAYLTAEEKKVIYILNLVRKYPKQFAQTVLAKYPDQKNGSYMTNSNYYKSLMDTLLKMPSVNSVVPDKKAYISAFCHAENNGTTGLTGHDRKSDSCAAKRYFNGECIDYGYKGALDILLHLLIDEGIESLGHRYICLNRYNTIGVSIQPHTLYGHCAVLDFHY